MSSVNLKANRSADPRASQEPQGACTLRLREAQSGQVPCSGAERRDKVLDEVSAAILGGVAAENANDEQGRINGVIVLIKGHLHHWQ